jgi:hypothetical protein
MSIGSSGIVPDVLEASAYDSDGEIMLTPEEKKKVAAVAHRHPALAPRLLSP